MSKDVKLNARASRYTTLVDEDLYRRAKNMASEQKLKWYQFLNRLLAEAVGKPVPDYLRPKTPKTKNKK